MVRTKVVKTLFSLSAGDVTPATFTAEQELIKDFDNTHSLYILLLDLVDEITRLEQQHLDEEAERAQIMHMDYNPNPRFVNNRFAMQLFNNKTLRRYKDEKHLRWDIAHSTLDTLHQQITQSDIFKAYLAAEESSYEADKLLWRKIFTNIFASNPQLESALDELEIALDGKNWCTDMDIVISYIIKTIKLFDEENGDEQPLMETFNTEDELIFGKKLLKQAIENEEEYNQLIDSKLRHWDADRIAYMDRIILRVSLAELLSFPEIAIQVTLNEYLDIAREYSTDHSPQFINGLLDEIIHELKDENKLLKAVMIR